MNVPIRKYLVHMRSVKAPVTPVIQIPACTIYFEKILCHGQVKEHKKYLMVRFPQPLLSELGNLTISSGTGFLLLCQVCVHVQLLDGPT